MYPRGGEHGKLDIADAVAKLRSELAQAILASADEELRFAVGEIELEFQVAVERSADGGIKFWVIEAGAGGKSTETHMVRIPLDPV